MNLSRPEKFCLWSLDLGHFFVDYLNKLAKDSK
jgi:hypothetical protein